MTYLLKLPIIQHKNKAHANGTIEITLTFREPTVPTAQDDLIDLQSDRSRLRDSTLILVWVANISLMMFALAMSRTAYPLRFNFAIFFAALVIIILSHTYLLGLSVNCLVRRVCSALLFLVAGRFNLSFSTFNAFCTIFAITCFAFSQHATLLNAFAALTRRFAFSVLNCFPQ